METSGTRGRWGGLDLNGARSTPRPLRHGGPGDPRDPGRHGGQPPAAARRSCRRAEVPPRRRRVQARRRPRGGRGVACRRTRGWTSSPTASCDATPSSATSWTRSRASTASAAGPSRSTTRRGTSSCSSGRWSSRSCAGGADVRGGVRVPRARTTRAVKVTLSARSRPRPTTTPRSRAGAYATRDAYLADIVDITRREVEELVRLGCTYIQIDAPQYAALLDPELREGYRQRGSDPDRLIDACIELDNAVIGAIRMSRSASTSAAATTRACSTRAAATSRSPGCSAAAVPSLPARVRRRALGRLRAAARARGPRRSCWG